MGFKPLNVNKLLGFIAVFWLDLKLQYGARRRFGFTTG